VALLKEKQKRRNLHEISEKYVEKSIEEKIENEIQRLRNVKEMKAS